MCLCLQVQGEGLVNKDLPSCWECPKCVQGITDPEVCYVLTPRQTVVHSRSVYTHILSTLMHTQLSVFALALWCELSLFYPAFTHTLGCSAKANGYCVSPVCSSFIIYSFFFFFFLVALLSVFFEFNLTPSVIRQRWIVGCWPPTAHPSPGPSGPQAGPRALCGLPAGWGGGLLRFLPSSYSSSSLLLFLLLSVTSLGGGPSAFSANQLETGERCRLSCVHPPVCRVHPTPFFSFPSFF